MIRWVLWVTLLVSLDGLTEERISHFHSQIEVSANGDITVTERITVNVEHNNIRRGIYRDFPTIYQTAWMTRSTVDFEILLIQRNGEAEAYHTEQLKNGVRVYIGDPGRMVPRGEQTYLISYQTNRQIAYLQDHDRFAWNVTGNDWRFAMDLVTAEVRLPDGVSMAMVNSGVWTGYGGETQADFSSEINGSVLTIRSTRALYPYQGMTFSLEIPKGFIHENRSALMDFLNDNIMWVLMLVVLISLIMFYSLAWHQVGRDPEPGVIMPLFHPPKDISPAAMRYVLDEKTDHKNFTAALISLAVKGYLKVKKTGSGYRLNKNPDHADRQAMASGERIIMRSLFRNQTTSITIDKSYDSKVKTAIKMVSNKLKSEYKDKCFKDNKMLGYFGIGISFVVLFLLILHVNNMNADSLARLITPLVFTAIAIFVVFKSNRGMWNNIVVLAHGAFMAIAAVASSGGLPLEVVGMCVFLVVLNGVYIYLLKAPTPFGRELMDQIEGFKLYLSTAEQHRLDIMHPPEMTPELFEKYLPYAIALGVENQWSERFANHLRASGTDHSSTGYHPNWYSGGHFNLSSTSGGFSGMSRGMASTISAAAVPPSSSSGGFSSGGGFSGGGGGGGGGGGW